MALGYLRKSPFQYGDEDLQLITQLLDSADKCARCANKAAVVLMTIEVIRKSLKPPLFKDKSLFKRNETLYIDCFLKFLIQEIQRYGHIRLTLPSSEKGIYLFEQ